MTLAMRICAALAVPLALSGCRETTPSEYVSTRRITALIDVTAESADRATVRAELHVEGAASGTYVVLDQGDELSVTAGGETKTLRAVGQGVYEATIKTGAAVEVTVDFDREKHADAPASKVTLPPPFTLESPAEGEALSRAGDAIDILWRDGAAVGGRVELSGSCIAPVSLAVAAGSTGLTIEAGALKPAGEKDADDTCEVELSVTFTRQGTADPALDRESRVTGHQVRRVLFDSAP